MAELDWAEWKGEKQPSGAAQQIADVLSANKKTQPSEYLDQMHPLPKIQDIDIPHAMGLGKKRQPITAILAQKVNQTNCDCRRADRGGRNKQGLPVKKPWRINSDQIFETREFDGS